MSMTASQRASLIDLCAVIMRNPYLSDDVRTRAQLLRYRLGGVSLFDVILGRVR